MDKLVSKLDIFLSKLRFESVTYEEKDWSYTLFRAGDVLKLKNGEYILVGHINEIRGVCDDCTANFELSDVVAISNVTWILEKEENEA